MVENFFAASRLPTARHSRFQLHTATLEAGYNVQTNPSHRTFVCALPFQQLRTRSEIATFDNCFKVPALATSLGCGVSFFLSPCGEQGNPLCLACRVTAITPCSPFTGRHVNCKFWSWPAPTSFCCWL